jgi:hypothetical protein
MGGESVEVTSHGLVGKMRVRPNVNLKALTVEELISKRKTMHLSAFQNLMADTSYYLESIVQENCSHDDLKWSQEWEGLVYTVPELLAKIKDDNLAVLKRHQDVPSNQYALDTVHRILVTEMLDTNSASISTLRFFLVAKRRKFRGSYGSVADFHEGIKARIGAHLAN